MILMKEKQLTLHIKALISKLMPGEELFLIQPKSLKQHPETTRNRVYYFLHKYNMKKQFRITKSTRFNRHKRIKTAFKVKRLTK